MTNSSLHTMTTKPTKPYKGLPMEGIIARWYNKNARRDPQFQDLAKRADEMFPSGSRVLEVAPGPGFLSIELAKKKFRVTGLDISKSFVEIASENAKQEGVNVDFRHGNASEMPFENETFDFIICTAAFKNFSDPVGAIAEMYRVLKPGGKAVIVDLRRDASRDAIEHEVANMHLNWLNAQFTRMTFYQVLLKSAYTKPEMEALVAQTNFKKYHFDLDAIGFELWLEH